MNYKREISEAAQWFLDEFSRVLNGFAKENNVKIFAFSRQGRVIIETEGGQRVCGLIRSTVDGRIRCSDSHKVTFPFVKKGDKPVLFECYAGFACVWIPISVRGSLLGFIVACGGRYDKGEKEKEPSERFSALADELGFMDKEDFIKAALEVDTVTQEEVQKRAEQLSGLTKILEEAATTPLKEVFG